MTITKSPHFPIDKWFLYDTMVPKRTKHNDTSKETTMPTTTDNATTIINLDWEILPLVKDAALRKTINTPWHARLEDAYERLAEKEQVVFVDGWYLTESDRVLGVTYECSNTECTCVRGNKPCDHKAERMLVVKMINKAKARREVDELFA